MIGFDKEFEQQCGEYLSYLYELGDRLYGDCSELDVLVQDTLTSLIVKMSRGERVEHPKGFLAAVLKNKYNGWLREKYKKEVVEYSEDNMPDTLNTIEEKEMAEQQSVEYTSVRREIGRLIRIYREVAVRHYVLLLYLTKYKKGL